MRGFPIDRQADHDSELPLRRMEIWVSQPELRDGKPSQQYCESRTELETVKLVSVRPAREGCFVPEVHHS